MGVVVPEILAGDAGCVSYLHPDVPERLIRFGEQEDTEHILCMMGGYEQVEADTDGVRWTDLRDYLLRRNCVIKIKRIPGLTDTERHLARAIWTAEVGNRYNWQDVARLGFLMILKRIGLKDLIPIVSKILPQGRGCMCSQTWIAFAHAVRPHHFLNPANYTPGKIDRDNRLHTIATWNGKEWV